MIAFSMKGHHLGDIVMALPVVDLAQSQGHEVGMLVDDRHTHLFRDRGIKFFQEFDIRHEYLRRVAVGRRHLTDMWAEQAAKAGIVGKLNRPTINYGTSPHLNCLTTEQDWVVVAPWCEERYKRWSIPRWAEVIKHLLNRGFAVAVSAPPHVAKYVDDLLTLVPEPVLNLCGLDTQMDWPSFLAKAGRVVCPDTGTIHVADAIGVSTVGLYGHSPVSTYAPYWDRRGVIQAHNYEMHGITVKQVTDRIDALWQ